MLDADTAFTTLSKIDVADAAQNQKASIYNFSLKKKAREAFATDNYLISILYIPNANTAPVSMNDATSFTEFVHSLPKSSEGLSLDIMTFTAHTPHNFIVDSVMAIKEHGQTTVLKGTIIAKVYLLKPYYQAINLQSNSYIINVKAKKTKLTYENGLPMLVDRVMDMDYTNKLYLIEFADNKYHFFKNGKVCRDCFYGDKAEEFIFEPTKGITSLKCYLPKISSFQLLGEKRNDAPVRTYMNADAYYQFK
ncbi:hypothetical protein LX64_04737 [Chitinophaga skermanii]|uniref:Uncharacterized protein n=2 Tax=Chitinophaga skermanii TaxID=331697 RepID=A0A327Q6C9_9BACT|nr:hypothetical protein LX64_04737 [Chitinophaga skermanii]